MVYCALPDPGQAGGLRIVRTGRCFVCPVRNGRCHGVLCTFRTGICIVYCQDMYCQGRQVYCAPLGQAGVFCMVRTGRCILYSRDRQAYYLYCQDKLYKRQIYSVLCALPDPGQAGVLCTARTGRGDCELSRLAGFLCSVRTGRSMVYCALSGQMYCLLSGLLLSGRASALCTVRTSRCILYVRDRQLYLVWSGQAGVLFVLSRQCLDRQLYCVLLCIVRPFSYP